MDNFQKNWITFEIVLTFDFLISFHMYVATPVAVPVPQRKYSGSSHGTRSPSYSPVSVPSSLTLL